MRFYLFLLVLVCTWFPTTYTYSQSFFNKAEVKKTHPYPTLWINDQKVAPIAYLSYLGQPKYYEQMAASGVQLFCLPAYFSDQGINSSSGIKPFRRSMWTGPKQYDFSIMQEEFKELISVAPNAQVIIRVHLDAPTWWQQLHPTEVSLQPDGSSLRVSFSSDRWRTDAGNALSALLQWIRESPFNRNLVGIHVAGGMTEEWFFHYKDGFYDNSQARAKHFQQFLQKRYNNSEKQLQQAWKDPKITFQTVKEADISGKVTIERLLNEESDTQRMDTYAFHKSIMPENIAYFTNIVKKESNNRLLTGAFYGYHLFVHDPRRGHGALHHVLQIPTLDYLSSPNDYKREVGIDWLPMAAIKSVQMHGKLWLAENDTRTHLSQHLKDTHPAIVAEAGTWYESNVWKGPEDPKIATNYLWKNTGRMLAYGYGGWWFDMWGGWFDFPAYQEVIQKSNQLFLESNETPGYTPEIALVVDEDFQFRDGTMGRWTGELMANRYAIGNIGAGVDIYLRSDLPRLKDTYKLIWVLACEQLTEDEQLTLDAKREKATLLLQTNRQGSIIENTELESIQLIPSKRQWTTNELIQLAKQANVHLFSDQGDVVYAGNGWLSVHTLHSGTRTIQLPKPWQLEAITPDTHYQLYNQTLTLDCQSSQTFLFRILPN